MSARSSSQSEKPAPRYLLFLETLLVASVCWRGVADDGDRNPRGEKQVEDVEVVADEVLDFVDIDMVIEHLEAGDNCPSRLVVGDAGEVGKPVAEGVGVLVQEVASVRLAGKAVLLALEVQPADQADVPDNAVLVRTDPVAKEECVPGGDMDVLGDDAGPFLDAPSDLAQVLVRVRGDQDPA